MRKFLRRELEHEIHGEALEIAFDCLDERTCLDAVERCQITIEHHALRRRHVGGDDETTIAADIIGAANAHVRLVVVHRHQKCADTKCR